MSICATTSCAFSAASSGRRSYPKARTERLRGPRHRHAGEAPRRRTGRSASRAHASGHRVARSRRAARRLGHRDGAISKGPQPTIAPVAERLARRRVEPIEKLDFAAPDNLVFQRALAATGARNAIVISMEAHVCVFQTVRELTARGVSVVVPLDGAASRRADHRAAGLELCRAAGATISTMSESVVFDWLRRAGTDEFKQLSKLIR